MHKLIIAFSVLLLAGACKPPQLTTPPEVYENTLRITYENLQDQTTHTVESLPTQQVEMFSMGAYPASTASIRQNIRPVYPFLDRTEEPEPEVAQHLLINFTHEMPIDQVEPVSGQSYGQLYTYIDRTQYVSAFFTPGRVFDDPAAVEIAMQIGTYWVSTRLRDATAPFTLTIDHATVFTNDEEQQSLYVEGHFQADMLVANQDAAVPEGSLRYRITSGQFSFVRVVDGTEIF